MLEAIALARAGRPTEADAARRRLAASADSFPGPVARRALHQLDGELALLRSDAPAAIRSFSQAERLLSARGFCGDHVPIWYGLARAQLLAADAQRAEPWFARIAGASFERLCWPIPYAGALAQLARLQADDHRDEAAAQNFHRFLALWGDGDLATNDIRAAKAYLDPDATAPESRPHEAAGFTGDGPSRNYCARTTGLRRLRWRGPECKTGCIG